jgi:hypothetical protein
MVVWNSKPTLSQLDLVRQAVRTVAAPLNRTHIWEPLKAQNRIESMQDIILPAMMETSRLDVADAEDDHLQVSF